MFLVRPDEHKRTGLIGGTVGQAFLAGRSDYLNHRYDMAKKAIETAKAEEDYLQSRVKNHIDNTKGYFDLSKLDRENRLGEAEHPGKESIARLNSDNKLRAVGSLTDENSAQMAYYTAQNLQRKPRSDYFAQLAKDEKNRGEAKYNFQSAGEDLKRKQALSQRDQYTVILEGLNAGNQRLFHDYATKVRNLIDPEWRDKEIKKEVEQREAAAQKNNQLFNRAKVTEEVKKEKIGKWDKDYARLMTLMKALKNEEVDLNAVSGKGNNSSAKPVTPVVGGMVNDDTQYQLTNEKSNIRFKGKGLSGEGVVEYVFSPATNQMFISLPNGLMEVKNFGSWQEFQRNYALNTPSNTNAASKVNFNIGNN